MGGVIGPLAFSTRISGSLALRLRGKHAASMAPSTNKDPADSHGSSRRIITPAALSRGRWLCGYLTLAWAAMPRTGPPDRPLCVRAWDAEHLMGRPGLDHLAEVHVDHVIRQPLCLPQRVRHDDRGVARSSGPAGGSQC